MIKVLTEEPREEIERYYNLNEVRKQDYVGVVFDDGTKGYYCCKATNTMGEEVFFPKINQHGSLQISYEERELFVFKTFKELTDWINE